MQSREESTLTDLFEQVLHRMSAGSGLSLTAASTLARVCTDGPIRLTDLSAREGVAQPSMTQLVNRLERDGYVQRTPSPDDGRVVLVEATVDGRELLTRRRGDQVAFLRAAFDRLPAKDQAAIDRAQPALRRLAQAALETPIDA